ncbi:MAG: dTDP-glucose 4,6-dehydratase, partial [Candidatus Woesebacteria bacterium GW2011_GWA1_43_12]
ENLKSVADNSHYQFIHGNICDASTVAEALRGVDTVVHFAAESHVDRSISEPSPFVMTNVVGTHVLLEAALKAKVKHFHHVSTDEVYGSLELDDPSKFNERTRYNPRSPYSASKAGSDHLVNAYHHTYGLPITITNCSNNFGPFHFPEKFIPLAITNILEGKTVPVYGDGKYVRDWLYVEDHCRAIEMVIQKGKLGETYCVGGLTQDIDNLSVVKKILHIMGSNESVIEFVKDRPGHDRKYAIDWTKIKQELGWEPKHDFDTCLAKTVSWYKEHESWWRPLKTT